MLDNSGHVEGVEHAAAEIVFIKKRRSNDDAAAREIFLIGLFCRRRSH